MSWANSRLALMVAIAALGLVGEAAAEDSDSPKVTCVEVTAEARLVGTAFNHLVHLRNGCSFSVECTVSTNVNKKRQKVTVPSKEKKTVLTWRGSPARTFKPRVSCRQR